MITQSMTQVILEKKNVWPCADYIDGTIADGEIVVKESNQCSAAGATFDKNAIQFGGKTHGAIASWKTGWNNQFALGYELGMYYNFTLEGENQVMLTDQQDVQALICQSLSGSTLQRIHLHKVMSCNVKSQIMLQKARTYELKD